jgi:hypothetical protein
VSAEDAAVRCSWGFSPEAAPFSEARSAVLFRVEPEGFFGAVSEGFAGSRCSMFFKLLRIDFERFSAMRAVTRD